MSFWERLVVVGTVAAAIMVVLFYLALLAVIIWGIIQVVNHVIG